MRFLLGRRALALTLALVGAWVLAASLLLSTGTAHARSTDGRPMRPASSHLLIYAQEWSLWPSRTHLRAGSVDVEMWNRGQDAHDTQIRRLNAMGQMVGPVLGQVASTPSGAIHSAVWHLRVGRYELFCSMPGHLQMGMHAVITVS